MYVPSKLISWSDPVVTVSNISSSLLLFKFGIVSGIIRYTAFIVLALILFALFSTVQKSAAWLMVALVVVSATLSFVNMAHQMALVSLIERDGFGQSLSQDQIHLLISQHLDHYRDGNLINHVFWGLWLLPFGYLVYQSGFLPRILGIFLMLGCAGYLIDFFGFFMVEDYGDTWIKTFAGIPASIGEIGICLWMLIFGAKQKPW